MKILILGAGKMGSFFADVLSFDHEVAILDTDPKRLRFTYNTQRMTSPDEAQAFAPELVINAVTLRYTVEAFNSVLSYLPETCILSDIASVKNGLEDFYRTSMHPYVSTHPMFGPTFASLNDLSSQNAIIISESSHLGKVFFRDLYQQLKLNVFEYTFREHDETIAYSLSIPFASTLVFASVMKHQDAPGTTFKKHMNIAKGLLSEDDFLLTEILFNRFTLEQLTSIRLKLRELIEIIDEKDMDKMKAFLGEVRKNIE
jgi:prephenate dehydrogenase